MFFANEENKKATYSINCGFYDKIIIKSVWAQALLAGVQIDEALSNKKMINSI